MLTEVNCASFDAMETHILQIESSFTRGFAGLQLIGNTTEVCRDGKERARAALENLNIFIPARRLVVSMTPADFRKDGNQFDLPFAISLALLIKPETPVINPQRWLFASELGLSGELKPVRGVVSFAIEAVRKGLEGIIVSRANLQELATLRKLASSDFNKLRIHGFQALPDVLNWVFTGDLSNASDLDSYREDAVAPATEASLLTFDDMILSEEMASVALVLATGLHSLLLRGTPGSGKSMFAARLASIFPTMTKSEHLEILRIQSAFSAKISPQLLAGRPPFRSPHHQATPPAILGNQDSPGELSLAHGGILFLDELPEFRHDLLESLREPLETGEVRISRARRKMTWKAKTVLVAACNNCPCGWFGSTRMLCSCPMAKLLAYRQKLSGPILDRIDIHFAVREPSDDAAHLFLRLASGPNEKNKTLRLAEQVAEARAFSLHRNKKYGVEFNRDLASAHLVEASGLCDKQFRTLINRCFPKHQSNRANAKTIRVARTLADLAMSEAIREEDFVQACRWQAVNVARAVGETA